MADVTVGIDELFDLDAVEALDGRQLRELFQRLDHVRRRTEAALVAVIGEVDRRGEHRGDGHTRVNAWCRALARWSDVECRDRIRTAKMIGSCDRFRDAVTTGEIGVAQSHELARAFANPRCGDQLAEVAEVMVEHATNLSHHEFRVVVKRWETLADLDGAHKTAAEAHEGRTAGISEVGEELHLQGRFGLAQGAIIKEIFDRFCDAEFTADWEATVARYGDAACYALMPRSDAQRRADALSKIFERAAAIEHDAKAALPLVNIVVDVTTLHTLLTGHPTTDTTTTTDGADGADTADGADRAEDPRRRRCETVDGTPVPPSDALAAVIWGQIRRVVVDPAGVVIDMGRRRRLFTGNARQAVLLQSSRCVVAGCAAPIQRCQADHLTEWSRHGPTNPANGAPLCGRHNRLKNHGYRVHRDADGYWHTYRPDGTEIT